VKALRRLARQSVSHLIRIACVLALAALAIMVFGVLWPRPLHVILSISLGHVLGIAATACYGLAVLLSTRQTPTEEAADTSSRPRP
jgi:hypothetical protein